MRAGERIKDTIVSVLLGTCAFILGFFMLIAVVLMIVLIAKMIATTPATASSPPQMPGVVLDDTYAPVVREAIDAHGLGDPHGIATANAFRFRLASYRKARGGET